MSTSQEPRAEAELVRRCRAGDPHAFAGLVDSYQDRIFATVYRILGDAEDARDLAQEAFLRAWSKIGSFREGARFSTWIYTIALNLTRSELRKRRVRQATKPTSLSGGSDGEGERPDPPDPRDGPDVDAARRELFALAMREVEALEPESKEVIVLRDMQDLSYEEIAEVLGVPVGTVRSRLHRARETLRRLLAPLVLGRGPAGGGR